MKQKAIEEKPEKVVKPWVVFNFDENKTQEFYMHGWLNTTKRLISWERKVEGKPIIKKPKN